MKSRNNQEGTDSADGITGTLDAFCLLDSGTDVDVCGLALEAALGICRAETDKSFDKFLCFLEGTDVDKAGRAAWGVLNCGIWGAFCGG